MAIVRRVERRIRVGRVVESERLAWGTGACSVSILPALALRCSAWLASIPQEVSRVCFGLGPFLPLHTPSSTQSDSERVLPFAFSFLQVLNNHRPGPPLLVLA